MYQPIEKEIFKEDFPKFELKSGMVIQGIKYLKDDHMYHCNFIVVDTPVGQMAVEEYISHDKVRVCDQTLASYCWLNREKYPELLGIDPQFIDEVTCIRPHMKWLNENDTIYPVVYYDENGMYCTKMNA